MSNIDWAVATVTHVVTAFLISIGDETLMTRLLFAVLFSFAFLAGRATADEVRTLGGRVQSGIVTEIDGKDVTITVEGKEVKTPLAQVLDLELRPVKALGPDTSYSIVRLLDDTVVQCKQVTFEGKSVKLTTMSGVSMTLPIKCLVSYLKEAGNKKFRAQFDEFGGNGTGRRRDRIFILSREGDLNPLDGTLGDVNDKESTIEFSLADPFSKLVQVKLEKLQGMVFYRKELPKFQPLCKVVDVDGNTFTATKLTYDGKSLNLTTGYGMNIPIQNATLAKIDFNLGRLTYRIDIDPRRDPDVCRDSNLGLRR